MAKTFSYGAEGPEIIELQQMLQACGSTIKVNGKFTIGMKSAVKAFQKKNGLPVTGIIDSKTLAKMKACSKPKKVPCKKKACKK